METSRIDITYQSSHILTCADEPGSRSGIIILLIRFLDKPFSSPKSVWLKFSGDISRQKNPHMFLKTPAPSPKDENVQSSWWFQPIWKILVKLDHFPRDRGENRKYLSRHHLDNSWSLKGSEPHYFSWLQIREWVKKTQIWDQLFSCLATMHAVHLGYPFYVILLCKPP